MAYGIGNWTDSEDAEDHLVLDELIMLHERYSKHQFRLMRFQAAIQGVDMGDDDEEVDQNGEELPPEILEMERAWAEKKRQAEESGEAEASRLGKLNIGYSKT